jgi:hypothetical protein
LHLNGGLVPERSQSMQPEQFKACAVKIQVSFGAPVKIAQVYSAILNDFCNRKMDMSGVITHDDFAGVGGDSSPTSGMRSGTGRGMQAARFSYRSRLFRLKHILHSPFVALPAVSGIVHEIATNKY